MGLAHLFDSYRDRVVVAEIDANASLHDDVDVVLYDSFAQPESDATEVAALVRNPRVRRVVVYTWNFQPELVETARALGVHGYLSKTLPARDLVAAIEAVHAGEQVFSTPPRRASSALGLDWPGRTEGITDRESEILALITQGRNNADIAAADLPQPQHREVLHPLDLPEDRGGQPHAGGAVGRRPRLRARPPPHRPLAGRAVGRRPPPPAGAVQGTPGQVGDRSRA